VTVGIASRLGFLEAYGHRRLAKADERAVAARFDAIWYVERYPDVAAAGVDPLRHFMTDGWKEGRWPNPGFDPAFYLARNPDVAAARLNPILHYIRYGEAEGRVTSASILDISSASNATAILARLHAAIEWRRARPEPPPLLPERTDAEILALHVDAAWYRQQYPDIASAGLDPLTDFMTEGWRAGRWPNPRFDPTWYLEHYPDVAALGANPLLHYIKYGRRENRHPMRLADERPIKPYPAPEAGHVGGNAAEILARMDVAIRFKPS
jgi:hypothetical protein